MSTDYNFLHLMTPERENSKKSPSWEQGDRKLEKHRRRWHTNGSGKPPGSRVTNFQGGELEAKG